MPPIRFRGFFVPAKVIYNPQINNEPVSKTEWYIFSVLYTLVYYWWKIPQSANRHSI